MKLLDQFTIYSEDRYHCGMPSAVVLPEGIILLAFRRAPDRRLDGAAQVTHIDMESEIVLSRSSDSGATWSEPLVIFRHPKGGCQDPCLHLLPDGSILCTSYGWQEIGSEKLANPENKIVAGPYAAFGGFMIKSEDSGLSWRAPATAPRLYHNTAQDISGVAIPAFNRGALATDSEESIYWGVTTHRSMTPPLGAIDLLKSKDGNSWQTISTIASEPDISFNETSLFITNSGDIVAFIRSMNADDHAFSSRSTDGGLTFSPPHDLGWQGHPLQAVALSDSRVLLVYGYRHQPFGIRARLLDAECNNAADAAEFVIRSDGGSWDIGYPWAVALPGEKAIIFYYYNLDDGPRHIAASLLQF
jgi:sialidase-1